MSGLDVLSKWQRLAQEVRDWTAAHPELAAAWDAAMLEDERHDDDLRRKRNELEILASAGAMLPRMGVPALAVGAIVNGIRHGFMKTEALEAARRFVTDKSKSTLVLFGGAGAGKTVAACWCLLRARSLSDFDDSWQLDPAVGAFVRSTAAARIPRFDESGAWDRILSVKWLVLDDLAVEGGGAFWAERLDELVDVRHSDRRRTVITCNLPPDEFQAKVGGRIMSRIREAGMVVGCGASDLRSGQVSA